MRVTVPTDRMSHAIPSWPRLLLAMVVSVGVVAACSGGGTAAPGSSAPGASSPAQSEAQSEAPAATQAPAGAATVDVCALLSVADVTAITGKATTPEATAPVEDWSAGECWWNGENFNPRFGLTVGTTASIAKSSSPTAKEQYDLSMQVFGGTSPDLVSGLGDAAFFGAGFVFAYKGGTFVQALGLPRDQLIAVMKLVLPKL